MKATAILKYAGATAVVAALALATAAPSQARHGRNAALFGGLAAGAVIGAAAANANNYYYGPGYYGPNYAYGPGPYAYEPAPVYAAPGPSYGGRCWHDSDSSRGYGYYGACY
jgi:hypothetical protein